MALIKINIAVDVSEIDKHFCGERQAIPLLQQKGLLNDNVLNRILDELKVKMCERFIIGSK